MKKNVLIWALAAMCFASGCAGGEGNTAQTLPAVEQTDCVSETEIQESFPGIDIRDGVEDYMSSVQERSAAIKDALEHDLLTQTDMNMKSQELYELWDAALKSILGELEISLSEEEFEKLQGDQCVWTAVKEKTIEEAGKEFEGGSLYALIVNGVAARLTEERVCELYELLEPTNQPRPGADCP